MKLTATLIAAVLCGLPLAAGAQTIYRCGGNEYTRIPCPDGRPVEATDTRSASQRAEARRILVEEEKRNKEVEHDRVKAESAIKPAAAGSLSAAPAASAASAPKKAASAKKRKRKAESETDADRDFAARAPRAPHASKSSSAPR